MAWIMFYVTMALAVEWWARLSPRRRFLPRTYTALFVRLATWPLGIWSIAREHY